VEASELREQTVEALQEELLRLRKDHFNLRVQRASGQLPQTHLVGEVRHDIARVKTVLREKQSG